MILVDLKIELILFLGDQMQFTGQIVVFFLEYFDLFLKVCYCFLEEVVLLSELTGLLEVFLIFYLVILQDLDFDGIIIKMALELVVSVVELTDPLL